MDDSRILIEENLNPFEPNSFGVDARPKTGNSPIFNITSGPGSTTAAVRKTGADDFLNSENDKNDYDWLLTPPGTPLFSSLEMESQKTIMSQLETPKARPTALKSRKTSFLLFLNKFDLFEKKVLNVPLNVCGWFKDYQPVSTGKQEIENAYE
ncbi:hypothetical protein ACS0TY_031335 [Phlomoides rotata]